MTRAENRREYREKRTKHYPPVYFHPLTRKSKNGVEHTWYKVLVPPFPQGENRKERRKVVALARKTTQKPNVHPKTKKSR